MTINKCPTCGRKFASPGNGAKVTAESRKQAKDKARAELAIASLDLVLANPNGLLTRCGDVLAPDFLDAVSAERLRLSLALANPEALRAIYRRNEARP